VMIIWFQNIPLFLSKIVKSKITFLAGILDKLENMWNDLCSFKHHLLSYLLISMFVQSVAIVIFWYVIAPFTNIPFELKHAATIFPIGMISIAIPISPAGLGVGHYVFDQLFSVLGFLNGASLFNIYFVIMIMTNLTGVIPYVLYSGKRISMKDVSEENI